MYAARVFVAALFARGYSSRPGGIMITSLMLTLALSGAPAGHVHGGGDDSSSAVPMNQKHPVDSRVDLPKGAMVELPGAKSRAYLMIPDGAPKGAILVLHEWWGLNDHIKHEADLFAKQG